MMTSTGLRGKDTGLIRWGRWRKKTRKDSGAIPVPGFFLKTVLSHPGMRGFSIFCFGEKKGV